MNQKLKQKAYFVDKYLNNLIKVERKGIY